MKNSSLYNNLVNECSRENVAKLLSVDSEVELNELYKHALNTKKQFTGNNIYLRGLIELSNICLKNCFYCGIRRGNGKVERYQMGFREIVDAAVYAWKNKFGSIVIQSGERNDKAFVLYIEELLEEIHRRTNHELGVTLSLGEQTEETYKRWFERGAHRYLLRIESSNEDLFYKIHPKDERHSYTKRLKALETIKKTGYQTGTGIMIGLPFQTIDHLADDLIFMKEFGVDMVGMGPYLEHKDTPLYQHRQLIPSPADRFRLSLNMIASLRLLMPDVNIASATALETLDPNGRIMALQAGANVFMPNLTPEENAINYFLYKNKPLFNGHNIKYLKDFEVKLQKSDQSIAYGEQGNSQRYSTRK